jgi:hypothetical protein
VITVSECAVSVLVVARHADRVGGELDERAALPRRVDRFVPLVADVLDAETAGGAVAVRGDRGLAAEECAAAGVGVSYVDGEGECGAAVRGETAGAVGAVSFAEAGERGLVRGCCGGERRRAAAATSRIASIASADDGSPRPRTTTGCPSTRIVRHSTRRLIR